MRLTYSASPQTRKKLVHKVAGKRWIMDNNNIFVIAIVGTTGEIKGTENNGFPIENDDFVVHNAPIAILPNFH